MTLRALLLGALCCAASLPAQPTDPWRNLAFLLGNWTGAAGEKDTPLGPGPGDFSFQLQLNRKIVMRRNQAGYDSGARHDDLMVIYLDAPDNTPRAIYFDSEGHVIRYNLSFPSANAATFESDGSQPGPRYRLSYWIEKGTLNGRFEVAPPGAEYKTYMNWTARKA